MIDGVVIVAKQTHDPFEGTRVDFTIDSLLVVLNQAILPVCGFF